MTSRPIRARAARFAVFAVLAGLVAGLTATVFAQGTSDPPALLAVVSPAQEGPCNVTDQYARGAYVVFRIQVVDPSTDQQLTSKDVSGVSIVLPDGETLAAKYGTHEGSKQAFWVAKWRVPGNYPTGQVAYKVEVQGTSRAVERLQFAVPDKAAHLSIVDSGDTN